MSGYVRKNTKMWDIEVELSWDRRNVEEKATH